MAEGGAGTNPQVFVVDSQASYIPLPSGRNPKWARFGQRFILLLVGLALLGLVVEGCFIYKLYNKTEVGTFMSYAEATHAMRQLPNGQTHLAQIHEKPFAHLLGSSKTVGKDKVVQWENNVSSAFTHHMIYKNGRLLVQEEGYYYLYSKVRLNAAEECSLIQHKVMKHTKAYGYSIELMKSSSFRCHPMKNPSAANHQMDPDAEDLWNSFLGGIFHLQIEDEIFVTLEDGGKILPGPTDNFMGAFMILSSTEF